MASEWLMETPNLSPYFPDSGPNLDHRETEPLNTSRPNKIEEAPQTGSVVDFFIKETNKTLEKLREQVTQNPEKTASSAHFSWSNLATTFQLGFEEGSRLIETDSQKSFFSPHVRFSNLEKHVHGELEVHANQKPTNEISIIELSGIEIGLFHFFSLDPKSLVLKSNGTLDFKAETSSLPIAVLAALKDQVDPQTFDDTKSFPPSVPGPVLLRLLLAKIPSEFLKQQTPSKAQHPLQVAMLAAENWLQKNSSSTTKTGADDRELFQIFQTLKHWIDILKPLPGSEIVVSGTDFLSETNSKTELSISTFKTALRINEKQQLELEIQNLDLDFQNAFKIWTPITLNTPPLSSAEFRDVPKPGLKLIYDPAADSWKASGHFGIMALGQVPFNGDLFFSTEIELNKSSLKTKPGTTKVLLNGQTTLANEPATLSIEMSSLEDGPQWIFDSKSTRPIQENFDTKIRLKSVFKGEPVSLETRWNPAEPLSFESLDSINSGSIKTPLSRFPTLSLKIGNQSYAIQVRFPDLDRSIAGQKDLLQNLSSNIEISIEPLKDANRNLVGKTEIKIKKPTKDLSSEDKTNSNDWEHWSIQFDSEKLKKGTVTLSNIHGNFSFKKTNQEHGFQIYEDLALSIRGEFSSKFSIAYPFSIETSRSEKKVPQILYDPETDRLELHDLDWIASFLIPKTKSFEGILKSEIAALKIPAAKISIPICFQNLKNLNGPCQIKIKVPNGINAVQNSNLLSPLFESLTLELIDWKGYDEKKGCYQGVYRLKTKLALGGLQNFEGLEMSLDRNSQEIEWTESFCIPRKEN